MSLSIAIVDIMVILSEEDYIMFKERHCSLMLKVCILLSFFKT